MATHSSILAFLLGKFHDRGAWQAIVHGVTKQLDVTEDRNTHKLVCVCVCVCVCITGKPRGPATQHKELYSVSFDKT